MRVMFAGNYLRVRGEYIFRQFSRPKRAELPPRARRIRNTVNFAGLLGGTTSACAENTCCNDWIAFNPRNYLRVRGEYYSRASQAGLMMELPPRARRILNRRRATSSHGGTTSACAENTQTLVGDINNNGNYLRVRGEYMPLLYSVACPGGTTSACAENTLGCFPLQSQKWNYLRVRGEYCAHARP